MSKIKVRIIHVVSGEVKEVPEHIAKNKSLLDAYGYKIEDLKYKEQSKSIITDNHQDTTTKKARYDEETHTWVFEDNPFEQEEKLQDSQPIKNKRGKKSKNNNL